MKFIIILVGDSQSCSFHIKSNNTIEFRAGKADKNLTKKGLAGSTGLTVVSAYIQCRTGSMKVEVGYLPVVQMLCKLQNKKP